MLHLAQPEDLVIGTGRSVSLKYFVERAFSHFGLDWRQHVRQDKGLLRPSDIRRGAANPARARERLGWHSRREVEDVVAGMCEDTARG